VKILDLGVARVCEDSADGPQTRAAAKLTHLGVIMGTADYMAPEQARDSREADARSDIYALGCTLYFALTGQVPFAGSNAIEKLLAHQLDEPTPLESLRPDVTLALVAVVRRMMAKNPADRYQTAAEVMEALRPFATVPVVPTPVPVVVPATVVSQPAATAVMPVILLRNELLPQRGVVFNPWVWLCAGFAFIWLVAFLVIRLVSG
jgi:serine/threonine-protein kinase